MGRLRPDLWVRGVDQIDLERLWNRGVRVLLLDLDNTVVPWGEWVPAPGLEAWIRRAEARGFRLALVSNSLGGRVRRLAEQLGLPAVAAGMKPSRRAFRAALRMLDAQPAGAAVVGDQLFTDILGARRAGLYAILVRPLSRREHLGTRIARRVERWVLGRWVRRGLLPPEALER